jgi:outer membrane protein assembly factor BamD (BamD/ComL family)
MGGKRTGPGQPVCFFLAGVIFLALPGCAAVNAVEENKEVREHLAGGQKLLAQGDYEGALKENQKVLAEASRGPYGDQALFNMGLLYAHYGNPKKDYVKSRGLFEKLAKDYPQSPLADQAKSWVAVLQANDALNQANEKLNEVIKKSKQIDIEIERKKRETEKQ